MLWPLPLTNNLQRVCISLLWKYDYRKVLKLIRAYQDADNTDSKDTMLEDVKLIANVIKTAPTSDTKHTFCWAIQGDMKRHYRYIRSAVSWFTLDKMTLNILMSLLIFMFLICLIRSFKISQIFVIWNLHQVGRLRRSYWRISSCKKTVPNTKRIFTFLV